MREQEARVDRVLGEARLVQRKEVANVVSHKGSSELCRCREHNGVVSANQLLVLSLDRLDIPPAPAKLGPDLRVQHLVKEELQG
jgi:hypothetical protein